MNKLNAYRNLLIRMAGVLLFVVVIAFATHADADARAEDEQQDQELQELTEEEKLANLMGTDSDDEEDYGEDSTAPKDTADADVAEVTDDPGKDDADAADLNNPGNDAADAGAGEGSGSGESSESGEDTVETGPTEEELAAQRAAELAKYKESPEYIESLLVTHPDHYDEAVVENARSIPTESDNDRYIFITGKKKKIYKVGNMPEGFKSDEETSSQMVTIDVPVWKMDSNGNKYSSYWPLTIHEKLADSCRCIFSDIFQLEIQFPFNYLRGYTYRKVGGVGLVNSKLMSTHAFGVALDINMGDYDNDYYLGKGNDLRNKKNPYCIPDEVIAIFEDYGWFWGGNYDICSDTMHFQYFELGFLQYESDEPFPILYRGAEDMDATVIKNLAQRLVRLGYLANETSNFSKKVDKAVKKFQADNGLEPDGIVDYETWEPLINQTHFMRYVF